MKKKESNAKYLLEKLGELSTYLAGIHASLEDCFDKPLHIMRESLGFDMSVLYKISNIVDNHLILEVFKVSDSKGGRPDLTEKIKISIDLLKVDHKFTNEANAFKNQNISAINIPGTGCDLVGFIYLPKSFGGGYLFGGDFFGHESSVKGYEVRVCEVMCNLLSSALLKTQFEQLAKYDNLTKLLNNRTIREELDKAFKRSLRTKNVHTSVGFGDIDFFKKINDRYGHIQGDSVLEEIGCLISENIRTEVDIAGRYGGEEFLIIFEADEKGAHQFVERLRKKISLHKFKKIGADGIPVANKFLNITISFGLCYISRENKVSSSKELLHLVDMALYKSKQRGRNQITIAG